jgi:intracellular septation protein A
MNLRVRLHLIIDVLRKNKEFILGPSITLVPQLFSLPLFISSFIFNCQNLEDSWLRHFLIVSYWISFTPQWTSFFLYISPSSFYSNEWRQTNLSRWIDNLLRHGHPPTSTAKSTTLFVTHGALEKDKH